MPAGARRGRATIIVDEWGPYDWKSPKLWPAGRDDALPLRLRVLGPAGRWRVVGARRRRAACPPTPVDVGDTITVTPMPGRETDFDVALEFRGAAVVTPFGEHIAAGQPVRFGWRRFVPTATVAPAFCAVGFHTYAAD